MGETVKAGEVGSAILQRRGAVGRGFGLAVDLALVLLCGLLLTLIHSAPAVHAQQVGASGPWQTYDTSNGEWRSYAGDIGGKKYSPLDQIDGGNFAELELVWEWTSVNTIVSKTTPGGGEWSAPLLFRESLSNC